MREMQQRLEATESRQNMMISFLGRVAHNPAVLQQLVAAAAQHAAVQRLGGSPGASDGAPRGAGWRRASPRGGGCGLAAFACTGQRPACARCNLRQVRAALKPPTAPCPPDPPPPLPAPSPPSPPATPARKKKRRARVAGGDDSDGGGGSGGAARHQVIQYAPPTDLNALLRGMASVLGQPLPPGVSGGASGSGTAGGGGGGGGLGLNGGLVGGAGGLGGGMHDFDSALSGLQLDAVSKGLGGLGGVARVTALRSRRVAVGRHPGGRAARRRAQRLLPRCAGARERQLLPALLRPRPRRCQLAPSPVDHTPDHEPGTFSPAGPTDSDDPGAARLAGCPGRHPCPR